MSQGTSFTNTLFLGTSASAPSVRTTPTAPVGPGNTGDISLGADGILYVYNGGGWEAVQAGQVNLTTDVTGVLPVANGGTNVSSLSGDRILLSNAGGTAIAESVALSNGQLLIGSGGAAPSASTLTAGGGVTVTNGPGVITFGTSAGGDLSGSLNNATVVALQGTAVSNTPPASGEVLKYNGAAWAPATDSAAPAGADTQIQYNSGGTAFGASASFTFDYTTYTLTVVNPLDATELTTVDYSQVGLANSNKTANLSASLGLALTDVGSNNSLLAQTVGNLATISSVDNLAAPMPLNFVIDELQINGDAGTLGYVLTSGGGGSAPTWEAPAAAGITALTGDVTATGPGPVAATLAAPGINRANNLGLTNLNGGSPAADDLRDIPAFNCNQAGAVTLLAPTGSQAGRQVTFINTSGGPLTINNIASASSRTMSAAGGSTWVYDGALNWCCTSNV